MLDCVPQSIWQLKQFRCFKKLGANELGCGLVSTNMYQGVLEYGMLVSTTAELRFFSTDRFKSFVFHSPKFLKFKQQ